jgi:hypothetical protein
VFERVGEEMMNSLACVVRREKQNDLESDNALLLLLFKRASSSSSSFSSFERERERKKERRAFRPTLTGRTMTTSDFVVAFSPKSGVLFLWVCTTF